MATTEKRRKENAPGELFVDSTCIDCDTCRWMAPGSFDRSGSKSRVHSQPETDEQWHAALKALVSCPTASIGTEGKRPMKDVLASFPDRVDGEVYHCGYHHESSFGAATYFIRRAEGNVLVDSPRFAKPLVKRLEELGGVRYLFLTHRDDIADHEKFREHFGCERILHQADARGVDVEIQIDDEVRDLASDLTLIPVPGHTRGSVCLRFDGRYLFSGDHVAFSPRLEHIYAFRSACWYDWDTQIESMQRLAEFDFEWILPGHGRRCRFSQERMRAEMQRALDWMGTV